MAEFRDPDNPLIDPSERDYPDSLEGYILISETDLMDPNFYRTVVVIIQHGEEGAFGLVVNRQSEATLGEVLEEAGDTPIADIPVYVGGPVQQEFLFVMHAGLPGMPENENALTPAAGVVFEPASPELLAWLTDAWNNESRDDHPSIHFFAGYCGWGPGQLEDELREGAWLIHEVRPDIVFHPDPQEAWKHALGKKGDFYKIVAETGFKPSMN